MTIADEPQKNEVTPVVPVGKTGVKTIDDNGLPTVSQAVDKSSFITIEAAKQQISADILSALAEKFNGKLSEVRRVDQKDILF